MQRSWPVLALVGFAAVSTAAPQTAANEIERLQLYNACRPVTLQVAVGRGRGVGVRERALQRAAESRLRAARLYARNLDESRGASLLVTAEVGPGKVFSVAVHFLKVVADLYGEMGGVPTWQTESQGTHGGDAQFVVGAVSRLLDDYIASYLRVNETACRENAQK